MEVLLFLMYPAGLVAICGMLFLHLRGSHTGQRALKIAKAHMAPVEDISKGFKAVETSVKALRAAKEAEQALYEEEWEKQFYTPEEYKELIDKRHHEKMLSEHKIKTRIIPADKIKTISAVSDETVPDGPEWVPLPHARKKDPDEELTYSQRRIQRAGAFVRSAPNTSASTYGVAEGGSVIRFDGYVHGQKVAGNDIWFVYIGKGSNLPKYVHSVATTNRSISGMQDLTEYETETVYNAAGDICATYNTRPTGGITMPAGSQYLQLPNATIRSREAENFHPKVYYYNDGSVKYVDSAEEDAAWQKHHRAKYERGVTEDLDPDQRRDKERQHAIVLNYQQHQGKYDPVPKEFIPSAIKKAKK